MWQIFAIITLIIGIGIYGILKFFDRGMRKIREKSSPKKLKDKFEDLLEWEVGDTIKYIDKYGYDEVCRVAVFKEDGIYGFDSKRLFEQWEANIERGFTDYGVDRMIFIPTKLIEENLDIEERKRYIDITSELDDEYSYHNNLVQIQDEYQKLNEEFNLSNNKDRVRE